MWGRGRGWRVGRREEHDTFGFGRRRTCQCSWPMERGCDVSSLSVNGYCRDLHICKTLGLLVASLSELPRGREKREEEGAGEGGERASSYLTLDGL